MVAKKSYDPDAVADCIKCSKCKEPLIMVFCRTIRDTCTPCGGKSKVEYMNPKERLYGTDNRDQKRSKA